MKEGRRETRTKGEREGVPTVLVCSTICELSNIVLNLYNKIRYEWGERVNCGVEGRGGGRQAYPCT